MNNTQPDKPRGPFSVTLKNRQFNSERFGIAFKDGVGKTDNATAAHACLELGADVKDASGKEAFPKPEPEQDPATPASPASPAKE